jgi:thioredoxin-related protein
MTTFNTITFLTTITMKTRNLIQNNLNKGIIALAMFFSFIALNASAANDSGLFVRTMTFEQLSAKAATEGTPIFLVIGSKNCFSYRRFCVKVLQNQELITYFKSNFMCYNVDVSTKEGRRLAKEYEAYVLPTIIFFTPDKKVHMSTNGSLDVNKVMAEADKALEMIRKTSLDKKGLKNRQLKAINKKTQRELGIEYAARDTREGRKDIKKQVAEYTFESRSLKYFKRAYASSMRKQN